MPVKLLGRLFRGKFLAHLKQAHQRGELTCQGRLRSLASPSALNRWLSPLYQKDWVVYAKPPWNGPENVLKYLARYTHRVAIANSRLLSIDQGQVTFTYKDYRHQHRRRTITLAATEFIRRFMMHVLPHRFVRIRYFGFLANKHREEQLRKIRELLDASQTTTGESASGDEPKESAETITERCPRCKQGLMQLIDMIPRPTILDILHLPLLEHT